MRRVGAGYPPPLNLCRSVSTILDDPCPTECVTGEKDRATADPRNGTHHLDPGGVVNALHDPTTVKRTGS